MKKFLALILAMAMIFALAACAPAANDAEDVNTPVEEAGSESSYANLGTAIELTSEEYGIGFRQGSDLVNAVNALIKDLNADGTLPALAEKYSLTLAPVAEVADIEATVKDLDYIKANGKLVIGITDYAPMNFKDEAGAWTGFDTEFAQAVCEKLGVTAEFVEIEWDNKFIALESKAIDCIWNGMTISEEVLKNTSCSMAYVKNAQVVVMAKDEIANYPDAASMKDLTFAVEAGSAGATAAADNGFETVETTAQTDALLEVASGSCDACIIDITMANAMLK
ncbi:MAG: transporter substrate-binding domain-containing protein [Oscillospiraceae bacterium]|nr:transporter substrate-binding domain-containing protein [Oscillospiraceae bacterium]